MPHYVITTDIVRAEHAEAYFGVQCKSFGGPDCQTSAVWLTKFGVPNQLMMLQEMSDNGAIPPPPEIPEGIALQSRCREIVRAIRPFPNAMGNSTICELRVYDIAESSGEAFLALKQEILPVRESYSPNFGVFVSVTGRHYRVMHLWGYTSVEERDTVRSRLKADSAWQEYISQILPMIEAMQSILITPVLPPARN
jgi:NIPSNAP